MQTFPRLPFVAGVIALLAGGWTIPLSGQDLSAQDIVNLAVARAAEQQASEVDLRFQVTVESITEHLDGEGQVRKTERETHRQYPIEGLWFEELIAKEGQPLDEDDARSEQQRRKEFAEDIRKRRAKGEDPLEEDEGRIDFDEEFVSRYTFRIAGEEVANGYTCWVVDFAPRGNDLPVRRRIDNALNNSTGRLWISQDDYGLARADFEMVKSVRFWGGVLGTLRNTAGRLEFARVANQVWMPKTIEVKLDLRVVFRNIRRRIVREWTGYSPLRVTDND